MFMSTQSAEHYNKLAIITGLHNDVLISINVTEVECKVLGLYQVLGFLGSGFEVQGVQGELQADIRIEN